MAEIKWIKMSVDIFNNRKIRQIESMPNGDGIIAIWLKILCLAGTVNDSGMIYLTRDIPYNEATLSTEFNRPLSLIQLALSTFQQFGMIEVVNNFICISNWEKYQNVDRMTEIREYNRLAQQKSREKRKELAFVNDTSMTSQSCHDTDIDKELEVDKEGDIEKKKPKKIADEPLDGFDVFWKAYPRKTAKEDARKAYAVLMKKKDAPTIERLIESIEAHKRSEAWKKDDGQFIPHPATYIRQGRYDDEIKDKAKAPEQPKTRHFDYDESGKVVEVWR